MVVNLGGKPVLEVKNLKKTYGDKLKFEALKGIDLTVKDGEFVGIMGPSGSGKTTFLNMLATIDQPTSGEVLYDGVDPQKFNPEELAQFRRQKLGFVFQNFNLLPTLTVEENIILPLTLDGERIPVMKKKVVDLAENLGITSLLNKKISEISGGQAQRVAVARAMIHAPQLVLADEPTGNLDSKSSADVMHLLENLNSKQQATILLVTHDPFAASFCRRIVFIKDGLLMREISQEGTRQEFYDSIMDHLREIEGAAHEF